MNTTVTIWEPEGLSGRKQHIWEQELLCILADMTRQIQAAPHGERSTELGWGPASATWQGTHLQYTLFASCSLQEGTELQRGQERGRELHAFLLGQCSWESPGWTKSWPWRWWMLRPQRKTHHEGKRGLAGELGSRGTRVGSGAGCIWDLNV